MEPARRGLLAFRWALLAVGLLTIGGVGGWLLHDQLEEPVRPVAVTVTQGAVAGIGDAQGRSMPDLTGLDEDGARAALAAVGLPPGRVRIEQVPAAGDPNVVFAQEPPGGRTLSADVEVLLQLSASTKVPDLREQQETAARAALTQLGSRVVREEVYAPEAEPGAVVDLRPSVGSVLPVEVTLVVAQSPSSVFVGELQTVESDCSGGEGTVDGQSFAEALVCTPGDEEPVVVEYALSRRAGRFEATFGVDDTSPDTLPVTLRLLVDGRVAATSQATFGEALPVSVDVRGGLRLRLEVSLVRPPAECCSSVTAVLGDARLVGAPSDIDALVADGTS